MRNEEDIKSLNADLNLTEYARAIYGRDSDYIAGLIAPDISEPDAVIGKFIPWEPATPTADQIGELMEPNQIDVNQDVDELKFTISDHELQAKVSRRLRSRLAAKGFSDDQIDSHVVRILAQKLKFMRDYYTLGAVKNTANYASGLINTTAATWGTSGAVGAGGPAYSAIMNAIDILTANGADESAIHIAASGQVWAAIRRDLIPLFSGISALITKEQVAEALGVRAVTCNLNVDGSNLLGSNVIVYASRPEGDFTSSAWHTVNAGLSGRPEPTIYRFTKPGAEHRWDGFGAYHDYQIVASGADKDNKQQLAYIFTNISAGFPS